ncbi:MAG: trigger factor [Buchnera aphidicola (Schlechtendalia chinensis)]
MELEIKRNEKLSRNIHVTIPNNIIKQSVQKELLKLKDTIRVDGFRIGKAPLYILKNYYKKNIKKNILEKLIKEHFTKIIQKKSFQVAGTPEFILKNYEKGKDYNYLIKFEIYPNIILNMKDLIINVPKIHITETDVQKATQKFLKNNEWKTTFNYINLKNRVTITCINHNSNNSFKKYDLHNFQFIIGRNEILPEIERIILNKKVNESFFVNITFSKHHCDKNIAGTTLKTEIIIKKVEKLKKNLKNYYNNQKLQLNKEQYQTIQNILHNQAKTIINNQIKTQITKYFMKCNNSIDIPSTIIKNTFLILKSKKINSYKKDKKNVFKTTYQQNLIEKSKYYAFSKILFNQFIKNYSLKPNWSTIQLLIKEIKISNNHEKKLIKLYHENKEINQYFNNIDLEQQIISTCLNYSIKKEKEYNFYEAEKKFCNTN